VLSQINIDSLVIVAYPDPVLRKKCVEVEAFDDDLARLAAKMCALMHEKKGVGLAAPQVGLALRLFVWNPTGEDDHDQVSVNPHLSDLTGQVEAEEGCLSLPDVNVRVKRASAARLSACNLRGEPYECVGEDLTARIWQHENDHLDGRLILDYQSPGEQIANRKYLKELTAKYKKRKPSMRKKPSTGRRGR